MGRLASELRNQLSDKRKGARLTQEQLAEAANVSRQTISSIEKGDYSPSTVLALRLSLLLNLPIEEGNGSEPNDKIVKWLLNSSSAITAKVKTSSRTARLPTANRSTSAMIAVGKAVKIPAQTPMLPKGARRSCKLTRNVQASGALRAPSGFLVTPLPAGSKKAEGLSSLAQTLAPAAQEEPEGEVLELDELWSFVFEKQRKRWIWIAQCRRTRQVVAYAIGDRGEATIAHPPY